MEPGPIERLYVRCARRSSSVLIRDREWRTKQCALHLRPLSDKVVYPRRMVDVVPVKMVDVAPVKKGRPK